MPWHPEILAGELTIRGRLNPTYKIIPGVFRELPAPLYVGRSTYISRTYYPPIKRRSPLHRHNKQTTKYLIGTDYLCVCVVQINLVYLEQNNQI